MQAANKGRVIHSPSFNFLLNAAPGWARRGTHGRGIPSLQTVRVDQAAWELYYGFIALIYAWCSICADMLSVFDTDAQNLTSAFHMIQDIAFTMASLIEEAIKLDVDRTMLNACNNFVEIIPASIAKLTKLKRFSAYDNALVELPPEIGALSELRMLNVRFNRLQCLPPEIGSLYQLRELHVESNRLTTLPVEVGKLSNLLKLDLR
jgi:hypothetical protein